MNTIENLNASIAEREQQAEQTRRDAERARVIDAELHDLRRNIASLEARRDGYLTAGDEPPRFPWVHVVAGVEYRMRPMETLLTGTELAEQIEGDIIYLKAEITRREQELAALL